jgi:hypothetical protein
MPPPPPLSREDDERQVTGLVKDYADADLEFFKSAVEQLRFVTKMFWEQAGFFVVIQTALLAVVSDALPKRTEQPETLLVLSILGLVLALFWGWVAWNRIWIIGLWGRRVRLLDREVDRHLIYDGVERELDSRPKLRKPTYATGLLPLLLAVGWISLLIASLVWVFS